MSGKSVTLNGRDGHCMRFTGCGSTDLPYMNEHATFNGGNKSTMCYEGHIGINGDYRKTIIGSDGKNFNTIGEYGLVGEAGITLASVGNNSFDHGRVTAFDVSVFGGTKCGAKMDLSGKSAVGGGSWTRFCLKGDLYGEYAHSLKNGQFIESMPTGLEQTQPKLSTLQAGAGVGFEIDATAQRLKVSAMAGPEFQYNKATIGDQTFEYKNGAIKANLGVEYTVHMPKYSSFGIVLEANAGLQAPLNIGKDGQGQIQVTGVTDASNVTPEFGISVKGIF